MFGVWTLSNHKVEELLYLWCHLSLHEKHTAVSEVLLLPLFNCSSVSMPKGPIQDEFLC